MMQKALLLIGSPKSRNSTSEAIADYLAVELQNHGVSSTKVHLHQALHLSSTQEALLTAVQDSDIIILSCPLYVDSTPAMVVKTMELIAERQKTIPPSKHQSLLAISNSGFPEAHHNHPALGIYKFFAREAGFDWAGGLAIGGGGAIAGRPLATLGRRVRNLLKALNLSALALAQGNPIPEQALILTEKPLFPHWLYMSIGQMGWYLQAFKLGTLKKLHDQPYQK